MHYVLRNIPMRVHLGVGEGERREKQKVLVTLSFFCDAQKAQKTDDINDVVDYFILEQALRDFPQDQEFKLLEMLHSKLITMIQTDFSDIEIEKLSIEKFPFEEGSVCVANA